MFKELFSLIWVVLRGAIVFAPLFLIGSHFTFGVFVVSILWVTLSLAFLFRKAFAGAPRESIATSEPSLGDDLSDSEPFLGDDLSEFAFMMSDDGYIKYN